MSVLTLLSLQIVSVFILLVLIARLDVKINRIKRYTEAVYSLPNKESTVIIREGEQGEQGERGFIGVKGDMPEGHWEEYCIYPENERGYRTQGAMIRESSGDCKSSWRIVEIWEK